MYCFFLSSCYCSLALSIPPLNNSTSDQFGIPTSFDCEPLFRTKTNQTPITVRSWFGSSLRLIHIVPVCLHRKKKKKHFVFRQENKPPYNLTTHRGGNITFKSFSYIWFVTHTMSRICPSASVGWFLADSDTAQSGEGKDSFTASVINQVLNGWIIPVDDAVNHCPSLRATAKDVEYNNDMLLNCECDSCEGKNKLNRGRGTNRHLKSIDRLGMLVASCPWEAKSKFFFCPSYVLNQRRQSTRDH